MRVLDLFAGIGGFTYAGHLLGGFTTTQFVENNPYCQKVLRKNFPLVPIHDDINTFDTSFKFGEFDLFTAGFPCQDLSSAGHQAGLQEGTRSSLFYRILEIARQVRPRFILFENVGNLISHSNGETFQEVLYQIAKAGYDAEWGVVSAKDVGACHLRKRIWIIAYANDPRYHRPPKCQDNSERTQTIVKWYDSFAELTRQTDTPTNTESIRRGGRDSQGCEVREQPLLQREQEGGSLGGQAQGCSSTPTNTTGSQGHEHETEREHGKARTQEIPRNGDCVEDTQVWRHTGWRLNPEWRSYVSQPVLRRGDDGLSNRVDRLKCLGNTICPQVATIPLNRIKQLDTLLQHR